jgi:hypothetical protein
MSLSVHQSVGPGRHDLPVLHLASTEGGGRDSEADGSGSGVQTFVPHGDREICGAERWLSPAVASAAQAFRSGLGPFLDSATEIEWVIHHQVASGDLTSGVVMNERNDRFKMAGGRMEPPVAGLFVIENGLITLWRDDFDLATFQTQLASVSSWSSLGRSGVPCWHCRSDHSRVG